MTVIILHWVKHANDKRRTWSCGPSAGPSRCEAQCLCAVLYDVIVFSQPCYDLFEKMAYMIQTTYCKRFEYSCYQFKFGLYEYQKTR